MNRSASKTKQPLAARAYNRIYENIVTLAYQPGQELQEKRLMAELGLGRTPVREALLRLAGEKMVESHPRKGFIVRPITLQNVKATFEMMRLLEIGAADLMARRDVTPFLEGMHAAHEDVRKAVEDRDVLGLVEANHRFHQHYARCSHNEYLVHCLEEVRSEAKRLSYLSYANELETGISLDDHYRLVIREHEEIIERLRKKETDKLKEVVLAHIRAFQNRIVFFMSA
ncbi:MAG: GntR family transcriptional regulator [Desulfobacteraceae bacterium]|nr:GntR family transcriptional regulator [Desulfobacteraceae bacterium]